MWHPLWLAGLLLVLAASVTMVFLGRWQMTVSESKGFDLQNFGYALQWWAFSVFAIGFWFKLVRDRANGVALQQPPKPRRTGGQSDAYRRYVMPSRTEDDDDPERARYNDYLRQLNEGR